MGNRCCGELAKYEQGFAAALAADGYRDRSIARHLAVLGDLDRWLDSEGLVRGDLNGERVQRFVAVRRERGHRCYRSVRGLAPLLGYLRGNGAIPPADGGVDVRGFGRILSDFRCYLVAERKLKPATADDYEYYAARFLSGLPADVAADVSLLAADDVVAGVRSRCRSRGRSWVKNFTCALRSLLRFLFLNGDVPTDLSGCVLPVAGWRSGRLPKALSDEDVAELVGGCHCRDAAVVSLALRLGLRAAEVAALTLDDVDWRVGEVVVHGKGGRVDRLPLPHDVGEAIVDYLRHERPLNSSRSVFISSVAPRVGISSKTVEGIVQRAARRAGLGPMGPHRLRHTAATRMLRSGASLAEIGQVLRHEHVATTALYARVDLASLMPLAMPWPRATT